MSAKSVSSACPSLTKQDSRVFKRKKDLLKIPLRYIPLLRDITYVKRIYTSIIGNGKLNKRSYSLFDLFRQIYDSTLLFLTYSIDNIEYTINTDFVKPFFTG